MKIKKESHVDIGAYLTLKVIFHQRLNFDLKEQPRSKITATGSRRILQERSGNVAGSCTKAPEIAGSGSSIPTGNLLDFFRWIPVNFLCFPAGTGRKSSEKIRKFSGGNTASTFQRFPVLSCRNRPVIFDLGKNN